jgi:type III restriction enzyme
MSPAEQPGAVEMLVGRVDAWRGFPLGPASEAWPAPGSYAPTRAGEGDVSETTRILLGHWFRPFPHDLPAAQGGGLFRYWPHQRRFVETVVYLHEVLGVRSVDALYDVLGVPRDFAAVDPWPKLGGQLATGSGKTKMMSLLVAWSTLNALREGPEHLGIGPQSVVIAPGLFVKERLLADFDPPAGSPSVFRADPVIPPDLESDWRLQVYDPESTPLRLAPGEPALVVTNIHQLQRIDEPPPRYATGRQAKLAFDVPDPRKLEDESTPLLSRFRYGRGLLVLNDEAHHVGDEPAHQRFEKEAANKRSAGVDASEAMGWIRSLRRLHERARLGLQVDLSATLYEEEGRARTGKSSRPGPPKPFRHTVVDYPLRDAISDGVVKQPFLEKVEVTSRDGVLEIVRKNQPDAWLTYEPLLRAGIGRWRKVRDRLRAEGDARKPILFLLCADRNEAQEITNYLTYGEATREDLAETRSVRGFVHPESQERLFAEDDGAGGLRSTVIQIHVGAKENRNEEEWAKVRAKINAVDREEIPNPLAGEPGQPAMMPNPYNVVVSVMMLKEGWDVRNVKVIVPLRSCDSRTLTEQTLGRGLRRMHPAEIDDDGRVTSVPEELYVMQHPSFDAIIQEISDVIRPLDPAAPPPPLEYVRVAPLEALEDRLERDVRLVWFLGEREQAQSWRDTFTVAELPPGSRLDWKDDFDEREVRTWLADALSGEDQEEQHFVLAATPAFRELDRVWEVGYVVPLLREINAAHVHKNDVKAVVIQFLRRSTFRLGRGQLLDFHAMFAEGGESAVMAIGNLLRGDVVAAVKDALRGPLRDAVAGRATGRVASLRTVLASSLDGYPTRKRHELRSTARSVFRNGAFDSEDELRFASLVDRSEDVVGWVYNHRQGVGFYVEYDWMGHLARYFPDFVVRVRWRDRLHNVLVEVKGRMDCRDEAKAAAGRRYVAQLTRSDEEPWHFLLLHEDAKVGRTDLSWWEEQSRAGMGELLRHVEGINGSDIQASLGWKLLTEDAVRRHVERSAGLNSGVTYDALMEDAEAGWADRDRLLVAAEALSTDDKPRLRRLFVDRETGEPASKEAVARALASAAAGDPEALRAMDVVYRPAGGAR